MPTIHLIAGALSVFHLFIFSMCLPQVTTGSVQSITRLAVKPSVWTLPYRNLFDGIIDLSPRVSFQAGITWIAYDDRYMWFLSFMVIP